MSNHSDALRNLRNKLQLQRQVCNVRGWRAPGNYPISNNAVDSFDIFYKTTPRILLKYSAVSIPVSVFVFYLSSHFYISMMVSDLGIDSSWISPSLQTYFHYGSIPLLLCFVTTFGIWFLRYAAYKHHRIWPVLFILWLSISIVPSSAVARISSSSGQSYLTSLLGSSVIIIAMGMLLIGGFADARDHLRARSLMLNLEDSGKSKTSLKYIALRAWWDADKPSALSLRYLIRILITIFLMAALIRSSARLRTIVILGDCGMLNVERFVATQSMPSEILGASLVRVIYQDGSCVVYAARQGGSTWVIYKNTAHDLCRVLYGSPSPLTLN